LEKWIPKEKKKSSMAANVRKADKLPESAGMIEGVNTNKGIKISGGTIGDYYKTLAVFCDDVLEKKDKIRRCHDDGDLSMYAIYVHALKSALANIGADILSQDAYDLEMAEGQGNTAFIEANNEHFLLKLEQLLDNIKNALSKYDANIKDAPITVTAQLKAALADLKSALEDFDADAMNKIVDNLMNLTQGTEINTAIRKISDNILMCEYDEAATLLDQFLREML
jgi:HPt (histidine-containing phosphotransfer) domain-containing protein